MEPLHQTSFQITLQEYKRFGYAMRGRILWASAGIVAVLLFLMGLLYSNPVVWIAAAAAAALYPVLLRGLMSRQLRREWNTNPVMQEPYQVFFYADHLEKMSASSKIQVAYDRIYKVKETQTHFYLMVSQNQGIIIVKENCLPDLIDFLGTLKNQRGRQRR